MYLLSWHGNNFRTRIAIALAVVAILTSMASPVQSQSYRGSIRGTITDPAAGSGLTLPQAQCPGCISTQTPDVAQGNPGLEEAARA